MTRRAEVAWRKKSVIRKIRAQENCGPRKKLTAAGMRKGPECKNCIKGRGLSQQLRVKIGIKDLSDRRPLYVRKKRATAIDMGRWSSRQLSLLGRRVSAYEALKKTLDLEFVKRARGMSSGLWKIRKWTLWRGRPPPKRKKRSCRE
jgi:hypothetical protein